MEICRGLMYWGLVGVWYVYIDTVFTWVHRCYKEDGQ